MSNPHPVKQVRKTDAMPDRMKAKLGRYVKRMRLPGEAMPYSINTFAKGPNKYKPEMLTSARDGADQHLQYRSRGM